MTARAAHLLYRVRYLASAIAVLGALAFVPAANLTRVENDIPSWFARDTPVYRDYDRFRAEFGDTQPLIIAFEAVQPDPTASTGTGMFTPARLAFLASMSEMLERLPTVQRVQSLSHSSVIRSAPAAIGDDAALEVGPLLDDVESRSPGEIFALARTDPLLQRGLLSDDGSVVSIIATFDEDRLDLERSAVLERIHTAVGAALPAGVIAHYNGTIEVRDTYDQVTIANSRRFLPLVLAITMVAAWLFLRSLSRTLIVLASLLVSVLWTLGLYQLMGFAFNILTAMLAPLVAVLAISDDVHLIQHYDRARLRLSAGSARDVFVDTVVALWRPLAAASGTTALGLLSLATSDVVAVREFGIGGAVGVMVDLLVSMVLVPTLLGFAGALPERKRDGLGLERRLSRTASFAAAHPVAVLVVVGGALAFSALGIGKLRVDTNHMNFFAASHPLGRAATVIDRDLAGVYSFHMLFEGPPDSMKRADTLARIDRVAADLRRVDGVAHVTTVADYVKRANQVLNDGRADAAVIPVSDEAVAQELLLLSLTDDGRRELDRFVSGDWSKAQMTVRLPAMNSERVYQQIDAASHLAASAFAGTPIVATATGSGRMFIELDQYLVSSQVSSFGTAFVAVFATLFVVFRSLKFGLLAVVPNLLPVVAVLGAMGWVGISINVATVMLASVALGIVDDDTVHYISRLRDELRQGASLLDAIGTAAGIEARAALTTALICSCGFAVLLLSDYKPAAWLGGLLGLTLAVAFVVELVVLPAVLSLFRRTFDTHSRDADG